MHQAYTAIRRGILLPLLFIFSYAFSQDLPPGFQSTRLARNLNPTDMKFSPDGQYLFVADKSGRIYLSYNDVWNPTPIIDFSPSVDAYNERGFNHLAVDPDFAGNGWIYVYYTVPDVAYNRVARYTFNFGTGLVDPASHTILLDLDPMTGTIHAGGAMNFAADGTLFVTTGESANPHFSQNTGSLLGKVLRMNKDGSLPTDNPFYNTLTGKYRYIYALGLRNPYTADVQPGTGRYFVCDVGESLYEEINEVMPGSNFGWNLIEGPKPANVTPPANYSDPLLYYHHDVGCAIVGGVFYNPASTNWPAQYAGKFFYSDYCNGTLRVMNPTTGAEESIFASNIGAPVANAIRPDGSLYYFDRGGAPYDGAIPRITSTNQGSLWKIVYTGSLAPHIGAHPDTLIAPVDSNVVFGVIVNGQDLSYQWIKGGVDIPGATQKTLTLNNVQLADSGSLYTVRISNPHGTVTSLPGLLKVTNRPPPEPVITLPAENFLYSANTSLSFSGTASDPVEGALPASKLTWKIDFHHDDHAHPVMAVTEGISSGSIFISPVNEVATNVWFRIYLTAENELGLTNTVFRDVHPHKVMINFAAPAGMPVNVNGTNVISPATIESVTGVVRTLASFFAFTINDTLFQFSHWGNGITDLQTSISTPAADSTIAPVYTKKAIWNGNGLTGHYFNLAYTQNFAGSPVLERIDTSINFNWGTGSPDPLVVADQFSVRWTGFVQPRTTGAWTFYVNSNDGVRLYVNNQLLIDRWAPQGTTEAQGSINLEAGLQYGIRLEYFDETGDAVAQLSWSGPNVAKQIIPRNAMFATAGAPLPVNFVDFDVKPQGDALQLTWKVEDLGNVKDFTVERRTLSGGNFEAIATIPGTGASIYTYTDRSVKTNTVYEYRIRETDHDGQFVFSPSRTGILSANTGFDFVVVPNPAGLNKRVQLVFTNEITSATVQLVNAAGQVRINRNLKAISGQSVDISLQGLAAGTYYIKLINGNTVITKKLLIQ